MEERGQHDAPTDPHAFAPAPWAAPSQEHAANPGFPTPSPQQFDAFVPQQQAAPQTWGHQAQQQQAQAHQPFGYAQPPGHEHGQAAPQLPAAPQFGQQQFPSEQQYHGHQQHTQQYADQHHAQHQHQHQHQAHPQAQQQPQFPGQPGAPAYQYGSAAIAAHPHQQHGQHAAQSPQHGGFPMPQGMPGGQPGGAVAVAAAPPAKGPGGLPRMRWETVIPVAAAALLLLSGVLVVKNFDRITGAEESLPKTASTATDTSGAGTTEPTEDVAADLPPVQNGNLPAEEPSVALAKVRKLTKLGRYDEAKTILKPVLAAGEPTDAMLAARDQLTSASRTNAKLMGLLGQQRQDASWYGMLTTLKKIEQLRPLSKDLLKIRAEAKAHVGLKSEKAANIKPSGRPPATPSAPHTGNHGAPPAAAAGAGTRPAAPTVPNPSTPPASVAPTAIAGSSAAGSGAADGCSEHTHNATRHGCS